jgi:hypothetical protein
MVALDFEDAAALWAGNGFVEVVALFGKGGGGDGQEG